MTIDAWPSSLDADASGREREQDRLHVLLPATTSGLILWLDHRQDETVVHVEGALDLAGGAELGATVGQVRTAAGGRVVVDATQLCFIDLSGYRALRASLAQTPESPDGARAVLLAGPAIRRLRHLVERAG
ncbi:MAG: hypothetical protein M3Z46_00980 [Actinomycetota bacterium]|nr:hypothetical protein [Actinomycetota bacterium]